MDEFRVIPKIAKSAMPSIKSVNQSKTLYYEEEIYDDPRYDSSRLEETDFDDHAEWIDEELPPSFKSKRQDN